MHFSDRNIRLKEKEGGRAGDIIPAAFSFYIKIRLAKKKVVYSLILCLLIWNDLKQVMLLTQILV